MNKENNNSTSAVISQINQQSHDDDMSGANEIGSHLIHNSTTGAIDIS